MAVKLLALRRTKSCAACTGAISAGARAWWDSDERNHTCVECQPVTGADARPTARIVTAPTGVAHRVAATTSVVTTTPTIETRPALRSRLAALTASGAVVFHGRFVPGTSDRLDHLVVSSSGLWLIGELLDEGRIEQRDVGAHSKYDWRLYVGGRDRTKEIAAVDWQAQALARAVTSRSVTAAGFHRALCFPNATWDEHVRPFPLDGVWVLWPEALFERIAESGPLAPEAVAAIGNELDLRLPVAAP